MHTRTGGFGGGSGGGGGQLGLPWVHGVGFGFGFGPGGGTGAVMPATWPGAVVRPAVESFSQQTWLYSGAADSATQVQTEQPGCEPHSKQHAAALSVCRLVTGLRSPPAR